MAPRILLATTVGWPSAARLAGAFAELGGRVEAVFPRGHVLSVSRYLVRAHRYRPLSPLASFAAAIAAAEPDLIVPCDDRALTHLLSLARLTPGLAALMARSLGRLESYPVLLERSRFVTAARAEGVIAPLTVGVTSKAELAGALKAVGLPAVLKTDASWGGGGVAVVQTRAAAVSAFRRLAGPPSRLRSVVRAVLRGDAHFLHTALAPQSASVSLQSFVRGKPATSAIACRDGEVLAALHMDVVESQGAAGPASLVRRTDCGTMAEAVRRIARRFRLSGLHGLDFVRDEDGVPHLIEINPRATQICHLALGARHDLAAALLDRPARPAATDKALVALFPQFWLHNFLGELPAAAYLDLPWDDPAVLRAAIGDRWDMADEFAALLEGGPRAPALRLGSSKS